MCKCVHRAAFGWFSVEPGWYQIPIEGMAKEEAQAVAIFAQFLAQDSFEGVCNSEVLRRSSRNGSLSSPRSPTQTQVIT